MSDTYVKVTDVEATIEEAKVFSHEIVHWLIDEHIILSEKTDCVLGEDLGYPPGPNVAQAVEYPERVYPKRLEYEQGDHPWGFRNLAFTFWNWTILKPDFLDEIARRLGHRIVVGADKL